MIDQSAEADARIDIIEHAAPFRNLRPGVRNRLLVQSNDLSRFSPFVVLVEDLIAPQDDDHVHPHRGFQTVTFVLDGEMTNIDHTGHNNSVRAGDVQWMNAGSGIFHGGQPAGGKEVHLLQLWLNLPNALRSTPPVTREQTREQAREIHQPGAVLRIYGERETGATPWSVHPLTLTDMHLEPGASATVQVPAGERTFLYVVVGDVAVDGSRLASGSVLWVAVAALAQTMRIAASDGARLVRYSSTPIDEPSVAHGPFVLANDTEVARALNELREGRLISG